jgi:hypothetical protein
MGNQVSGKNSGNVRAQSIVPAIKIPNQLPERFLLSSSRFIGFPTKEERFRENSRLLVSTEFTQSPEEFIVIRIAGIQVC